MPNLPAHRKVADRGFKIMALIETDQLEKKYEVGDSVVYALDKVSLGTSIGKAQRTAVALLDPGFVKMLKKAMLVDK